MRVLAAFLFLAMAGCSVSPPTPFVYGEQVDAPEACYQYTVRGGKCSLLHALDEVHARFEYSDDNDNYRELKNPINRYQVDYWTLLPESGKGDCEDFALTLRWFLNSRGITGTNLVTSLMPDGGDHVVLEIDGWVMDNTSHFPRRRDDLMREGWAFISAGDESGLWREIIR